MPDISLCLNTTCRLKEQCYRYTATPKDHNQSYMNFQGDTDRTKCREFIDNSKRR